MRVADLELDENSHEVTRNGVEVNLTTTEFELLRYLMRNERVVLSKGQILDRVWRYDFKGRSNIVELYIGYLRKKVDNVEPKLIHTIRGAGYVLKAPRNDGRADATTTSAVAPTLPYRPARAGSGRCCRPGGRGHRDAHRGAVGLLPTEQAGPTAPVDGQLRPDKRAVGHIRCTGVSGPQVVYLAAYERSGTQIAIPTSAIWPHSR